MTVLNVSMKSSIKTVISQPERQRQRLRSCGNPLPTTGFPTPSREHERMIQSTQRKMLRLIIQTKRKYKKIEKQVIEHKDEEGIADKTENCSTDDESGDGQSTKSEDDVDSGVTIDEDSEKEN